MPSFTPFEQVETFDSVAFREDSHQLEELRTRDFSSMIEELSTVLQFSDAEPRFIPLVWRVCRELAAQYVKAPTHVFLNVSATQATKMAEVYARGRFNQFMGRTQQKLVAQRSQIIAVDPVGPREVRYASWSPFEAEVFFADPMEEDIRRAERVELAVPVLRSRDSPDFGGETIVKGLRVYTRAEAWTEFDGSKRGLFTGSTTDLSNPFGFIPLAAIRLEEPVKGRYFPPLATDMLTMQIAINLAISDMEVIARHQCYGRETLTGGGAKTAVKQRASGPDMMRIFPGDAQYTFHETNPAIDKYVLAIDTALQWFAATNYISLDSLTGSTGITGDAKQVERQDRTEERERTETVMRDAEEDLAQMTAAVLNTVGGIVAIPTNVSTQVDYHYVEPKQNTLQASQAREIDFAQGLDSPAEVESRTSGVSLLVADARVKARLEERAEQLGTASSGNTQGLDRVARAVDE